MTTESDRNPEEIRARIEALLTELPGESAASGELPGQDAIDAVARRLEEAHNVLVQALESVERG